ncbi:MAG: cell division ATPase MinD [Candidatus Hydrothermarchaeales archaeon]
MGVTITIASGKGGVGKTSLTANLGIALAEFGKDVTLLDADIEMANLELHLGLEGMKVTLNNVLSGDAEIEDSIYQGPGGVKVIPAGISLDGLKNADPDRLKSVLRQLMDMTDILLIDSPPGLGKAVITALATAQEVILVVIPEISSMSDALKTKIVAKKLGTHILGAVINRAGYDEKTDLTTPEVEAILEVNVLGVIPEDVELRRSTTFGQAIMIRRPDSPAAIAIKHLAAELIGEKYIYEGPKEGMLRRFLSGLLGG